MKTNEKLNLTMLCDFYELTMGNGYFVDGKADQICYFDGRSGAGGRVYPRSAFF